MEKSEVRRLVLQALNELGTSNHSRLQIIRKILEINKNVTDEVLRGPDYGSKTRLKNSPFLEAIEYLTDKQLIELVSPYYESPIGLVSFSARITAKGKDVVDEPNKLDIEVPVVNQTITKHPAKETVGEKIKGGKMAIMKLEKKEKSDLVWKEIEKDHAISKVGFGKKISFIKDEYKREILFRDVEQAYDLASLGYNKPAVILAGGVIEEIFRLFLEKKNIKPADKTLEKYIEACSANDLKKAVESLSSAIRNFRNMVHISLEKSPRETISKSTANAAVASIFIVANEIQSLI